jgi:hypothetical protein
VIHYHGTPITPRAKLLELAGRCFCVSYAEPRDIGICHEIGQSVMLDNGAYSAWRTGRPTNWPAYHDWCSRWLERTTTWAVIPDLIDGTPAANDELIAAWPHGTRGAPVWHLHEPLHRLQQLVAGWPLVCIGSSGQYADLLTPAWRARMAAAMDTACYPDGQPRTRLHLLRGLALSNGPYPLHSADSTSIAQNHAGNRTRATPPKNVRAMADTIDARQPAPRWQPPHHQLTFDAQTL